MKATMIIKPCGNEWHVMKQLNPNSKIWINCKKKPFSCYAKAEYYVGRILQKKRRD